MDDLVERDSPAGTRLPSYRACRYCGMDCPFVVAGEPCWGEVQVTSDFADSEEIHTCEGHATYHYRSPPVEVER
jgi:hypothetical protein